MSKFHSTVSRRDFMKGLGLTGAGLGAASLVSTGFHDMDELLSMPGYRDTERKWWVEEIDYPKMFEFNEEYNRYDQRVPTIYGYTPLEFGQLQAQAKANTIENCKKAANGYSRRDLALKFGGRTASFVVNDVLNTPTWIKDNTMIMVMVQPEELGVAKWNGTPEENTRTLKNAARFYGVDLVTVTELDERFFYAHTGSAKIEFRDVEEYSEEPGLVIIPKKFRYAVSLAIRWATPITKVRVSPLGDASGRDSIDVLYTEVKPRLSEFLRYIGYNAIPSTPALDVPLSIAGGMAELTRTNRLVSPEFGPSFYMTTMITDFPMAPDKPIDIGLKEFCTTCMKCADACPSGALSFEKEPYWETKGEWNNKGHKAWFENSKNCMGFWLETNTLCGICFRECPFSKYDAANVHELIKITASKTSLFNGFFRSMDDFMGYGGQWDADEVWAKEWSPRAWYAK
ncbi:reductive dehalogenase [Dehalogenimonas lykanthroporepellens BL-DC-9]|nr:reductive dehalogenase [Dehalogenimonas lykanthroporepellens BL-DC-9]